MTLYLGQTLWLLSPELALLVAGALIVGLNIIRPRLEDRHWPVSIALVGVAGALIATITLWGCNTRVLSVLSCDPFALTIKMLTLLTTGAVILISDTYMRARSQQPGGFYALLLLSALAICLLGGATNLTMIFLALDFLNITSYILTGYLRDDRRSTEAAIKHFLYGATLSTVMLYGMSWFYGLTGTTDLGNIARVLREADDTLRPILLPALIFVMAGLAFKIGAVPFHQWAPDAYEGAPTPTTAFLSAGSTTAGFALIVRVVLTALPLDLENLAMDWQTLLMALATLTMTVGNLIALWQQNIKRLFAYSSIAQAGYVLIGVVAASPRGVAGALFYLIVYALACVGAFAAMVAFSNQTGSDAIEDYAGLGKRAPALALVLTVCTLSLGGIPPTAGFVGKLYLFTAAVEKGLIWLAAAGVINSVISLAHYWKVINAVYIAPAQTEDALEISASPTVALGMTATIMLIAGIFPGPLLALVQAAVRTLFG